MTSEKYLEEEIGKILKIKKINFRFSALTGVGAGLS